MRRLFVCVLMMTILSACNMCSKTPAPTTDEAAVPAPVATTSPAASNACDELKCGSDQVQPSKGATASAPTASSPSAPPSVQAPVAGATSATASATPTPPTVTAPIVKAPAPGAVSPPTVAPADSDQQLRLSRDPFRRYVGGGGIMTGRYPELTNLPLTSFRYVGIVKNEEENLALLEDHSGNGHTVRVGTRIGKEGGQISQISEQEIVVKTLRKDSSGRSTTKYFRLPFYVKM